MANTGLAKAHNKENYTDEWYTPAYAINPILKYLKPKSKIWLPFDTKESNYVKILKKAGHSVHHSHIDGGGTSSTLNLLKESNISSLIHLIQRETKLLIDYIKLVFHSWC